MGANSDSDLSHFKGKALDARNSSWLALHGGVVVGGGSALRNAVKSLPDTVGGIIMKEALLYPIRQILENSGEKYQAKTGKVGYNSKSGKWEDLDKAGVLDASMVVKTSITNALSIASTALTIRNVIL